jgi:hypothetical protein
VIKFLEPSIKTRLTKKYIQLYQEVREQRYPIETCFLVTKIKFQEYIIDQMFEYPAQTREIITAYSKIKENGDIQEKALRTYELNSKYEVYFDGVKRS